MRARTFVFAMVGLFGLLVSRSGPAAEGEGEGPLGIDIIGGTMQSIPIALPVPNGLAGEAASTFRAVVARDLVLSGWFDVIETAAYIEPVGTSLKLGQFKWEDWEIPGSVALAKTGLSLEDGKLRGEVWTYDVPGRRKLGAKAFAVPEGGERALAHRVANEIILRVTGQGGPFNTRFAFAGNFTGNKEIYLVDFDGSNRTPITKNGSINLQPAWSPDGRSIAFTSYMAGNPDLYLADLAAGRIRRLSSRIGINTGAAFHPNGGVMALTLSPAGDPEICLLDVADGRQIARLTKSMGIDASPAFSPDGTKIAFVSERSGGAQIYVMNADGSDVRRVTFNGGHNTDPVFSPDGGRIAFVARDGVFDVFTTRVDGTGLTRITQAAGSNEDPSWSPDGQYIAFSSTRTGEAHIWMSTADGRYQVQLTEGKGGYTNPAWSPALE